MGLEGFDYLILKGWKFDHQSTFIRIWKPGNKAANTSRRFIGHTEKALKDAIDYINGDYHG